MPPSRRTAPQPSSADGAEPSGDRTMRQDRCPDDERAGRAGDSPVLRFAQVGTARAACAGFRSCVGHRCAASWRCSTKPHRSAARRNVERQHRTRVRSAAWPSAAKRGRAETASSRRASRSRGPRRRASARARDGERAPPAGAPPDVFGGELRRRDVFPLLVLHLIARGAPYGNRLIEEIEGITEGDLGQPEHDVPAAARARGARA